MKILNKLLALIFIAIGCTNTKPSNTNNFACRKVEEQLLVIKNFIADKNSNSHLQRVGAVAFLEELTDIQSQSDGNDIGQLNPTDEDYVKWSRWYKSNKDKLYWDNVKKAVLVGK